MAWELNPATNEIITAAIKQGHRIVACPSCGGPQIFSLTKPKSRCFRCNRYQEGDWCQQSTKRLQCEDCHAKFTKKGLRTRYCRKCSVKRKVLNGQATAPLSREKMLEIGAKNDII